MPVDCRPPSRLKFADFMRLLLRGWGSRHVAELAETRDVTQPTAKRWLRILEACGIVFFSILLEQPTETTISAPKLYFQIQD